MKNTLIIIIIAVATWYLLKKRTNPAGKEKESIAETWVSQLKSGVFADIFPASDSKQSIVDNLNPYPDSGTISNSDRNTSTSGRRTTTTTVPRSTATATFSKNKKQSTPFI